MIKSSLITCFLSVLFLTLVWAKASLRGQVLELLPKELASLTPQMTRQELETKFASKISKKDQEDTLYLSYFDEKNDVSIGTEKGKLSYLYVEVPASLNSSHPKIFDNILSQLSDEAKKKIISENQKKISHESGRYILIDLPEEGLKLEFVNNESKALRSIILYPQEIK
jgi:hypothetical protein